MAPDDLAAISLFGSLIIAMVHLTTPWLTQDAIYVPLYGAIILFECLWFHRRYPPGTPLEEYP